MRCDAFLIPAYNPGSHLSVVVNGLREQLRLIPSTLPIIVVDDGSTDGSANAEQLGGAADDLIVIKHPTNRGKGAALQTGFAWAQAHGMHCVTTLDADGQHPPSEAIRVAQLEADEAALVVGVRNLQRAGAPRKNQLSNAFSNRVLSFFAGQKLLDTQCGLRRYPVDQTLALGAPASGYAWESDLLLRGARRGLSIVHEDCLVIYPPSEERLSYFDSVRDPARIVMSVLWTTATVPHARWTRRLSEGAWIIAILLGLLWLFGARNF